MRAGPFSAASDAASHSALLVLASDLSASLPPSPLRPQSPHLHRCTPLYVVLYQQPPLAASLMWTRAGRLPNYSAPLLQWEFIRISAVRGSEGRESGVVRPAMERERRPFLDGGFQVQGSVVYDMSLGWSFAIECISSQF